MWLPSFLSHTHWTVKWYSLLGAQRSLDSGVSERDTIVGIPSITAYLKLYPQINHVVTEEEE